MDGRNPAPVGNYWQLWNTVNNGITAGWTSYQLVQDFFHPQHVKLPEGERKKLLCELKAKAWDVKNRITPTSSDPILTHCSEIIYDISSGNICMYMYIHTYLWYTYIYMEYMFWQSIWHLFWHTIWHSSFDRMLPPRQLCHGLWQLKATRGSSASFAVLAKHETMEIWTMKWSCFMFIRY